MRVALVHDWLTGMRGGEKCLEVFCRLFPEADLFTLLHIPGKMSPVIESMKIHTSCLQKIPFIGNRYRYFLPIMPWVIRQFDLQDYDFILSSSHCVAKGIRPGPNSLHVCYCYTPMRYIWDQYDHYFGKGNTSFLVAQAMRQVRPWLRRWDVKTSRKVDHFIAISQFVQKRIETYYHRESDVIYPPVDTGFFSPTGENAEDYFLIVSALAPYKRIDLAIEAFNELGYPLKIVGEGQDSGPLQERARSNIEFSGWLSDSEVRSCYARCRAFIFPGEEDFGITPLEAQAMGRPVIALARGGALETVIPDKTFRKNGFSSSSREAFAPTGVFFEEPSVEALIGAIRHFESIEHQFDPPSIRDHARKFDSNVFTDQIRNRIGVHIQNH